MSNDHLAGVLDGVNSMVKQYQDEHARLRAELEQARRDLDQSDRVANILGRDFRAMRAERDAIQEELTVARQVHSSFPGCPDASEVIAGQALRLEELMRRVASAEAERDAMRAERDAVAESNATFDRVTHKARTIALQREVESLKMKLAMSERDLDVVSADGRLRTEERDAATARAEAAEARATEMHRRAQSAEGFRDRSFRYQRHLIETSMERDQERSRRERAEARAERAERACVDIFNAFATSKSIDQAVSVRNAWALGREIVVRELDAKCSKENMP